MDARQIARELDGAGGAYVLRECCGRKPGETLTRAELSTFNLSNLIALVKQEKLRVWPMAPGASPQGPAERIAVHRGSGKYDVIEGVKLNDEPLSRAEAEALCVSAQQAKH